MKLTKILRYFFLLLSFIIIYTSIYIRYDFNNISFEQLLFTINTIEGSSFSAIKNGLIFVFTFTLISMIVILSFEIIMKKMQYRFIFYIKIKRNKKKNKDIKINIFPLSSLQKRLGTVFLFIISIIFSSYHLRIFDFLKSQISKTTIFEYYYVDARNINYKFPENKRNLIYIFAESLEMTNASTNNGGYVNSSYIPFLENLAMENTNFSNTEKLGGFYTPTGTTWTSGAMVGQTAGVPLKISVDKNAYRGYGEFLPGVYSLGDILNDNGYKNYFMLGSIADFGGRKDYFVYHGNYEIFDYKWAIKENLIADDYYVWWGFEDKKLFEFAKDKILDISQNEEPFNFTLLTVDTHFVDGYLDESCNSEFDSKYANTFYCSDYMINEFINWIKSQPFYENTTIVIAGDHLTMQNDFYENINDKDRTVYNVFINSAQEDKNSDNRIFTTFDMFPTTLASLGVGFEGDRLGLGTNLYSNKKTLAEELGFEYLTEELNKKSDFYDYYILKDSYFKMEKNIHEKKDNDFNCYLCDN